MLIKIAGRTHGSFRLRYFCSLFEGNRESGKLYGKVSIFNPFRITVIPCAEMRTGKFPVKTANPRGQSPTGNEIQLIEKSSILLQTRFNRGTTLAAKSTIYGLFCPAANAESRFFLFYLRCSRCRSIFSGICNYWSPRYLRDFIDQVF